MSASHTLNTALSTQGHVTTALAQAAKDTKTNNVTSIADDIKSLVATISKIPTSFDTKAADTTPKSPTSPDNKEAYAERFINGTEFLISNEDFSQGVSDELTRLANTGKIDKTINAGIVVGNSHLFSFAPELSQFLDVIILFDTNLVFHDHIKQLLDAINISETREEFFYHYIQIMRKIHDNKYKIQHPAMVVILQEQFDLIGGKYFIFSSEKRFQLCKQSLKKLAFMHYREDFSNISGIKKLSDALTNSQLKTKCVVRLLNITNLNTYIEDKALQASLNAIPLTADTSILHSFPYPTVPNKCISFVTKNADVSTMQQKQKMLNATLSQTIDNMFQKATIKKIGFAFFISQYFTYEKHIAAMEQEEHELSIATTAPAASTMTAAELPFKP